MINIITLLNNKNKLLFPFIIAILLLFLTIFYLSHVIKDNRDNKKIILELRNSIVTNKKVCETNEYVLKQYYADLRELTEILEAEQVKVIEEFLEERKNEAVDILGNIDDIIVGMREAYRKASSNEAPKRSN